jgi:hypothetical protein
MSVQIEALGETENASESKPSPWIANPDAVTVLVPTRETRIGPAD